MSAPDHARLAKHGERRRLPRGLDSKAAVDGLLVEMWRSAREAGLSADEAGLVCRVMTFRIKDEMEADVTEADRILREFQPVAAGRLAGALHDEVERIRRVAQWEESLQAGGSASARTA